VRNFILLSLRRTVRALAPNHVIAATILFHYEARYKTKRNLLKQTRIVGLTTFECAVDCTPFAGPSDSDGQRPRHIAIISSFTSAELSFKVKLFGVPPFLMTIKLSV